MCQNFDENDFVWDLSRASIILNSAQNLVKKQNNLRFSMILVRDLPTGSFSDLEACPSAESEVDHPKYVNNDRKARKHSKVASFQVQTTSSQKKQAQGRAALWNVNKVKMFPVIFKIVSNIIDNYWKQI